MSEQFKVKWYQGLAFPIFAFTYLFMLVLLSPMFLIEWLWKEYRDGVLKEEFEKKHGSVCKECGQVKP